MSSPTMSGATLPMVKASGACALTVGSFLFTALFSPPQPLVQTTARSTRLPQASFRMSTILLAELWDIGRHLRPIMRIILSYEVLLIIVTAGEGYDWQQPRIVLF